MAPEKVGKKEKHEPKNISNSSIGAFRHLSIHHCSMAECRQLPAVKLAKNFYGCQYGQHGKRRESQ